MGDRTLSVLVLAVAVAHVAVYVVAWCWAARSRHLGFLVLMVPTALAWSLAGYPLVRVVTYGTRPFGSPAGGLQTAGFAAILLGFGGFFVCALGTLMTIVLAGRRVRVAKPDASSR